MWAADVLEMFIPPPNMMLGTHPEQVWGLGTGSKKIKTLKVKAWGYSEMRNWLPERN